VSCKVREKDGDGRISSARTQSEDRTDCEADGGRTFTRLAQQHPCGRGETRGTTGLESAVAASTGNRICGILRKDAKLRNKLGD
ncbi:hypothetical protein J6590_099528, partial [Homalodisca vitripennis]